MANHKFVDEFISILQEFADGLNETEENNATQSGTNAAISVTKQRILLRIDILKFDIELMEENEDLDGKDFCFDEISALIRKTEADIEKYSRETTDFDVAYVIAMRVFLQKFGQLKDTIN